MIKKKYISYVLSKGKSDSQNSIGLMIESCINLEDFVQGYKLIVSLQLRWRQAKINQALFCFEQQINQALGIADHYQPM